jgi:hypothetical protein
VTRDIIITIITIITITTIIIMCAQQHFNICKEIGIKLNKHGYDCEPKSVETSYEGKVTTLWNKECN